MSMHCGFTCCTKSGLTSHLRHRHPDIATNGLRPLNLRPSSAPPQSAPPVPVPSSTATADPVPSSTATAPVPVPSSTATAVPLPSRTATAPVPVPSSTSTAGPSGFICNRIDVDVSADLRPGFGLVSHSKLEGMPETNTIGQMRQRWIDERLIPNIIIKYNLLKPRKIRKRPV
ncbi:hypothetical protein M8J75_014816 [Diaphorina citri]|nr:hypothetical protein M8J75_014816 [Diaphorina citri]